jgi:hypothetical protein
MGAAPVLAPRSKAHTADDNVRRFAARTPMIRISLSYVYGYARQLEPLTAIPSMECKLSDIFLDLFNAKSALDGMHSSVFGPYLVSSYPPYQALTESISAYFAKYDPNRIVQNFEIASLKRQVEEYRIAFLAEVSVMNAYFVTQKGGFDTRSLLLWGENCFPSDLKTKVPDAVFDAREAAKSIAYEQPTACGFHVFRALLEAVLRKYHSTVTGGASPPKVRNIGVYLVACENL